MGLHFHRNCLILVCPMSLLTSKVTEVCYSSVSGIDVEDQNKEVTQTSQANLRPQ